MTSLVSVLSLLFLQTVQSEAKTQTQKTSVLVISLPSVPNSREHDHYAGRLFPGTWRWVDQKGRPEAVDPVRALTEAALKCGQRRFQWRGLDTDHGNEMIFANDQAGQRALTCMGRKVSFDFYARVERITAN
jgi:hypothetical protein